MVGRPRQFDEQEALDRAMQVFWAQGYEATSVQDLLDAMEINRGSMYHTFGDKHALFTAAIERYGATVICQFEQSLSCGDSAVDCIRRMLIDAGGHAPRKGEACRGCFATNAIVELAPHDPLVAKSAQRLLKRIECAFEASLNRAVEAGELSPSADASALASFLCTTLQGLIVLRKASVPRARINDAVDVAMAALGE